MRKEQYTFLLSLLLASSILIFSGCGSLSEVQAAPTPTLSATGPDTVQIEILQFSTINTRPVLTLRDKARVQKLYTLIQALPAQPVQQACTADLGRQYQLTFQQGRQQLSTVSAQRYGCHPVSIGNEKRPRQSSKDFGHN